MAKTKNDKRRQHYVPKFYLRNFSENKKSVGLYLFDASKIIEHGSIEDVLWKEYFYGKDAVVENKLAEYEGKWNNIVSAIIETERLPDDKRESVLLRYFILISSARTLRRGNEADKDYTDLLTKVLEAEEPALYERVMSGGEDGFAVKINYPALAFINAARQCIPLVIDLKMNLLINRSAIDYVTSDNPTVFYNQLYEAKNLSRGFGWGEYGIQFIIPISPKIAICMYDSEVYTIKERIIKSSSKVKKLNELFLNNSDKLIIFMYGGDDAEKAKKSSYVNSLVKSRRIHSSIQEADSDVIKFSNKQIIGRYDLSDVFEIKQKYMKMSISDHSEEEINEKKGAEIAKLVESLQAMTEDERQTLLKNKKAELIGFSFSDMVRPWVKFFDTHQEEIMAHFEPGEK